MTLTLTTITREEALDLLLRGTQTKRAEIEESIRDLRSQLNGDALNPLALGERMAAGITFTRKHAKRSAAVRKRMAEAQRARWAKVKR